jgi:hypothetical protein
MQREIRKFVQYFFFILTVFCFPSTVFAQTTTFTISQPKAAVYGPFQGFGAEWDPFFWNTNNQNRGVTDADWQLITSRIQELHVGIIRMMTQLYWATDDPNLSHWTWDTPQMTSVKNTLPLPAVTIFLSC